MDMSSFPRMLEFKRKTLPQAQLLRWSNWFSQWKFTAKHIKGKSNIMADFLSRPNDYKRKCSAKLMPIHTPKILPMVYTINRASSSTPAPPGASSSTPPPPSPLGILPGASSSSPIPSNILPVLSLPEEIVESIADITFEKRSVPNHQKFLTVLLRKYGLFMSGLKFHPDYPFLNTFHVHYLYNLPKEALCFFWYLLESYSILFSFHSNKLLSYVLQCMYGNVPPPARNLFKFLEWFLPGHQWSKQLGPSQEKYVVFALRRPCSFLPPSMITSQTQAVVYHMPSSHILYWYSVNPSSITCKIRHYDLYMGMRKAMAQANGIDPDTIPHQIMYEFVTWTDDHPVAEEWINAYDEWKKTHLLPKIESSDSFEMGGEDDNDSVRSYTDPYNDDPSHPDSQWK